MKDTHKLKVQGWKDTFHANGKEKSWGSNAYICKDRFYLFFKRFYLFLERGRKKERERNITVWLPLMHVGNHPAWFQKL